MILLNIAISIILSYYVYSTLNDRRKANNRLVEDKVKILYAMYKGLDKRMLVLEKEKFVIDNDDTDG